MRRMFQILGDVVGCTALFALFWMALVLGHAMGVQ